jgi:hypothetical protein
LAARVGNNTLLNLKGTEDISREVKIEFLGE